jgi:ATP-dependent DNA ligase
MVEGAQPLAEMPGFIPPQLATLKMKAPAGDRWIHEIKYDSYRLQGRVDKGRARMFTRSGLDWTKKFHLIAEAFEGLPIERGIFDGEVCVVKDGRTDFSALQAELSSGRQRALEFYAFDCSTWTASTSGRARRSSASGSWRCCSRRPALRSRWSTASTWPRARPCSRRRLG